ncbi:MAG: apolipoprotein N-acyltransferase [Magnetococcales bacterium]|nr:apolipoprotein N-acyltransferase [Magnetococcales bacterium]
MGWSDRGWIGRLLLAAAAGGLAMWGLPPEPSPWPTVIGLAVWLRVLEGVVATGRRAWLGLAFGLGHFVPGLIWLWTSLHIYGKLPGVVAGLMIFGLAAILSGYTAGFAIVLPRLAPGYGVLPLAAAALWVVGEWLRAHLFSGFPWNLIGYVWDGADPLVQIADLGGVYLLSGLTFFLAGVVAVVTRPATWQYNRQAGMAWLLVSGVVVGAGWSYGQGRLQELASVGSGQPLRVAMVQGNIAQDVKWDPARQKEWLNRYLDLSAALEQGVELVVWPETAAAFFLQFTPKSLENIVEISRGLRAPILTGAPMAMRDEKQEWQYFNSMVLIHADEIGDFVHRYDKHHLVPFGEYIPFRSVVPASMQKLTHGAKDFSAGPGPKILESEMGALGPLICYEVIFPDEVRELARQKARWLVNATNDGWFGESAKPQHLAMARMRAVENRLPMIRVANSGISAAFDHLGRELGRIPSNAQGSLVVMVPEGPGESFWSRFGHLGIWVWSGLCLVVWGAGRIFLSVRWPEVQDHPILTRRQ